jgi:amino acid transporter
VEEGGGREGTTGLKRGILGLVDLVSLSTSGIAPVFSISQTLGVVFLTSGNKSFISALIIYPLLSLVAIAFFALNRLYPNAGASYYWYKIAFGNRIGNSLAWIVTMHYFLMIPSIVIATSSMTLSAFGLEINNLNIILMSLLWIAVATIILLFGTKVTARFTQFFFFSELAIFVLLVVLSFNNSHKVAINQDTFYISMSSLPMLVTSSLILFNLYDGWEVDSYASEESKKPKRYPGIGDLIGVNICLIIVVTSILIFPTITGFSSDSPLFATSYLNYLASLINSSLIPLVFLGTIASASSSLWLTMFTLSRLFYAMGRDFLISPRFSRTNNNGVPKVSTVFVGFLSVLSILPLISSALSNFYTSILSLSSVFLVIDFSLGLIAFNRIVRDRRDLFRKSWVLVKSGRKLSIIASFIMIVFAVITILTEDLIIYFILFMLPALLIYFRKTDK